MCVEYGLILFSVRIVVEYVGLGAWYLVEWVLFGVGIIEYDVLIDA